MPNSLLASSNISEDLFNDINNALPERSNPIDVNPNLASAETNLVLTDNADVWVTFVGEGAGYRNAFRVLHLSCRARATIG